MKTRACINRLTFSGFKPRGAVSPAPPRDVKVYSKMLKSKALARPVHTEALLRSNAYRVFNIVDTHISITWLHVRIC